VRDLKLAVRDLKLAKNVSETKKKGRGYCSGSHGRRQCLRGVPRHTTTSTYALATGQPPRARYLGAYPR
jgi:hypothetical protein